MNKKLLLLVCNVFFVCYPSDNSCGGNDPCLDVVTVQNRRPCQEDAFISIISSSNLKNGSLFAVFDGHVDPFVSYYLSRNLPEKFANYLNEPLAEKEAFERAFSNCEEYILKNYSSGSTALVVYIDHGNAVRIAHIANVGDSRVVFGSNKVVFFTKDQTLTRVDERDRVLKAEGIVYRYRSDDRKLFTPWRINGLMMSRSMGDRWSKGKLQGAINQSIKLAESMQIDNTILYLKQWPKEKLPDGIECVPKENQVIAEPEYMQEVLTSEHRWLILATDGLWDEMSNEKALDIVQTWYNRKKSLVGVAQELAWVAVSNGSEDNITVFVVDLLNLGSKK